MIKEMLERRRRKRLCRDLRKRMAEVGIFTYHLTDDELLEQGSVWAKMVSEAFKPLLLTMEQMGEAVRKVTEAFDEFELPISKKEE